MKIPAVPAILKGPVGMYAALGVGAYVFVVYLLPKLTQKLAQAPGNTLNALNQGLGNNDLTNSQTDFGGDAVNYSGHGPISTLGAEANSLSGGLFASIGEWIGGHLPGSGNDYDPNAQTSGTTRDQVVTPNYVPDISALGVGP